MNYFRKTHPYFFVIVLVSSMLIGCKKDKSSEDEPIIKKEPVITWADPADIVFGTLLSSTQCNAKANVIGTFVYTPPEGTKLAEGMKQDLKVDFNPTDAVHYNSATKIVKINVTNAYGIIFNPELNYGTMKDQEGNSYKTINIGSQTWMTENLRTTKYNDNTLIPFVAEGGGWINSIEPGYCWYNNDSAYRYIYGALYNWNTVNTGKLAPSGWHVPTDAEWATLLTYLGGAELAGIKLKETGTKHWSENAGATNESGFTALPAGFRFSNSLYNFLGSNCCLWSSTPFGPDGVWCREITYYGAVVMRSSYGISNGFSVRCIKD